LYRRSITLLAITCLGCIALTAPSMASKSVVVFPFDNNTRNPTMEWIGESFVESFNEQLASPWLTPFSLGQRNAAYDLLGLPYEGDFSRATLLKVGEELDANFVIFGSYRYENSEFSATAQLIDLESSRLEEEFTEKGPLDSLKRIQSRIAWRILTHFDSTFPYSQEAFYKLFDEVPLSAFENYVRGQRALDSRSQLQYFLKAERIDPTYSKAIFRIGKVYFQLKDYATSQLWLRRINKNDRHFFYEATFYLGLDYYFMKDFEKASSQFTLLSIDLPLNEVFNNLAASLGRLGNSNLVVHNYQIAIDGDPGEGDFYFNLGYYYWKSQDYRAATRCFRDALQLNPQDAEAAYLLGTSLESMKQAEESLQYLKLASRLNPKAASWSPSTLPPLERVKLNYDAEAFNEFKAALDHIYEQKLKDRSVAEQILQHMKDGMKHFKALENEDALKEFAEVISLDARSSEAYLYRGQTYERMGKFEDATRELKASLVHKDSVEGHLALAHLYYQLGRRTEAQMEVSATLALDPANAAAKEMSSLLQQNALAPRK
jgi:tetratricopeptide (TPR) repeat protein